LRRVLPIFICREAKSQRTRWTSWALQARCCHGATAGGADLLRVDHRSANRDEAARARPRNCDIAPWRWIRIRRSLRAYNVPGSSKVQENGMAKLDLESLNIEELATLRDTVIEKLTEKVAARQAELESELEKLNLYGKPVKKAQPTPAAKPKKDDARKEPAARAA
jgi:hypothetical protein